MTLGKYLWRRGSFELRLKLTQSEQGNTYSCASIMHAGATMIRLAMLCAVVLILGCSVWSGEWQSRYEFAAHSWLGASIEDMVAAWGTPNRGYKPPGVGEEGIAGWGRSSQTGIGANKTYRYRCETLAYFDSNGIIKRIVVKHSRSCDRLYEGPFKKMTRLESPPITT